jgi:hypothetical protein
VALAAFQTALAELICTPELREAVREDADRALEGWDLSERERRRIATLARDSRLEVAVMLHERRRLGGMLTALPRTCDLLGRGTVERLLRDYGRTSPATSFAFVSEGLGFGRFLMSALDSEASAPYLARDVLAFELALLELEDVPRAPAAASNVAQAYPTLAPGLRLVALEHGPRQLLSALEGERPEPVEVSDEWLLVRRTEDGRFAAEAVDPRLAAVVRLCDGSATVGALCESEQLDLDDFVAVAEAGYVVLAADSASAR